MNRLALSAIAATTLSFNSMAQTLIIRGDDIGAFHAVNEAVIKCYTDGIERSCELMTVTPWFPEAVKMLNANPGLDVGIHVAFTSEWENMKWRPLTAARTLVDKNGFFYVGTGKKVEYPGSSIEENIDKVDLKEVEAEMRAQIELAMANVKNVTHISSHMLWSEMPGFEEIALRLSKEYGLPLTDSRKFVPDGVTYIRMNLDRYATSEQRINRMLEILPTLDKDKTYYFLDHPAYDNEEMRSIYHIGYENVAQDRQAVTEFFTSSKLKKYIKEHEIKLISLGDYYRQHK